MRCGANSLHPSWREGAAAADWDLQLSPYQPGGADWPAVRPGHKWDGLHGHLLADQSWKAYDYIWLPDDDLANYRGVLGHYHVQLNKVDPGPAFQWETVINGARALIPPAAATVLEKPAERMMRSRH